MGKRWVAVLQALLVTFLWSTSWVLTKWVYALGFKPLTMSGLRYGAAALALGLWALGRRRRAATGARGRDLAVAAGLGLLGIGVTQGGQNLGLYFMDAAATSLVLGLANTLLVLLLSAAVVREAPNRLQVGGIGLGLAGLALYYYPWRPDQFILAGLVPLLAAAVGYAGWSVGNRLLLRDGRLGALGATLPAMVAGSLALLSAGLWLEPLPPPDWRALAIIGWMALVNTALAFTLWAHTQRVLAAYESSIINNTMMPQVALLAWAFLGEAPSGRQWLAIAAVAAATLLVQVAPALERRRVGRSAQG